MVSALLVFPFFACFLSGVAGIECYTGLKVIAGQSVGSATINCGNSGSQCYNMSASAAALLDIVKAGCSLWRCMVRALFENKQDIQLARDRCISTTFKSVPISLCCCSTDRCNVNNAIGGNEGFDQKQVGGWNAEPDHSGRGEEQMTREDVRRVFSSAEADDDVPTHAPRGSRRG